MQRNLFKLPFISFISHHYTDFIMVMDSLVVVVVVGSGSKKKKKKKVNKMTLFLTTTYTF